MSAFGNSNTAGSGPSLFGTQNSNQPSTSSSLFGLTTANPSPLQPQPTQPVLFSNTSSTNTTNTGGGPATNTNTTGTTGTGGIFGSTATNPSTNTATSLFGNQPNAPAGGSSLFGSTAASSSTTTPSLFGGGSTTAPTTGPSGGPSLFGSTANNPLFGGTGTSTNANTGGTSMFGNPNPTTTGNTTGGGLFGNPTTNTNTNMGGSGGGLFGSATTNTGGSTGGLFGSSNTGTTGGGGGGGGLFGSNIGTTGTTGGLFGSNPNTQPPGGNTGATTNLFGNTTGALFGGSKPAGTGLFGSTANNPLFGSGQQPQQQSSLFGSTAGNPLFGAGQQPQQQSSLFGSTAGNPLFGAGQQPQQQSSLFGSTAGNPLFGAGQQPQQQPSLFGSTAGNPLFGSTNKSNPTQPQPISGLTTSTLGAPSNFLGPRPAIATQQQSADAQAQDQRLLQLIEAVYSAWSPQSKDCRFQYPFYNLVDPKHVSLYGRPPNATNDALWAKAVKENPDPSCLVPVIAIGFDDLRARVDAQTAQSTTHLQRLKDLQSRLDALRTQHSVSNTSRLLRATALQTQLTQRVLQLVQHLHLLIPSIRSSALRPEEEALRGKLEEIEEEMRRGRVRGRLNELWALIGAIGAGSQRVNPGSEGDWAVVDDEGLSQIVQILMEQQAGLQHLTRILQKDLKDLGMIMGTKGSIEEAYADASGEKLWASTSTLRASSLR